MTGDKKPDNKCREAAADSHNYQVFGKPIGNLLPGGFRILGGFHHFYNLS